MLEEALASVKALLAPHLAGASPVTLAIDGRCASGKTTLATRLTEQTVAALIHLDDFFLRPEQRTPERLATPGENVDWERLVREVLEPLGAGRTSQYCPFDCHTLGYKPAVTIAPAPLVILEGSYSCNDHLWEYSDYHVFLTVSPEEQLRRIALRNGEEAARVFQERWIPLEEAYFTACNVAARCDLVLSTD